MKKIIFFICLFFGSSSVVPAQEGQVDATLYLQANQAYKSGDFTTAAMQYEKLLSSGLVNGDMYYNLGNAYLKKGAIGHAVLNFRMAERFLPRDADIEANLQYALDQTKDKIDCSGNASFWKTFFFWLYKFSSRELCYGFLGFNIIFWVILGIKFFFRTDSLGIAASIALFFTILFAASFLVKYYQTSCVLNAVVLAPEIQVRSGSSPSDTVLFKLHEGAELTVAEEENEWVRILLCDGKKGWVQKSLIGILPGA